MSRNSLLSLLLLWAPWCLRYDTCASPICPFSATQRKVESDRCNSMQHALNITGLTFMFESQPPACLSVGFNEGVKCSYGNGFKWSRLD